VTTFSLIVDGYNLIRQSPELRQYDKKELAAGREMLLKKLLAYQRLKKRSITVVFDGWEEGGLIENRDRCGGIEVIYSQRGEKADEVIKRLARRRGQEAVVVTSDRELGHACSQEGCSVVTSQEFEARLALADYAEHKGGTTEVQGDLSSGPLRGTKKKGPSRRLPKAKRHHSTLLGKL
jgi:uncharacterized protein